MKFQPRTSLSLGVAIIALLSSAIPAQAIVYYWDTDGNGTSGFGTASGTWGTDPFWSQDATGGGASAPTNATITTADAVNFGTNTVGAGLGAGTINGPATAQGFLTMTFGSQSGAIVLSGGTLNLAGTSTITVNNSTATISSVLQGSSNLTKGGAGKLVLSGANTYTGLTTIGPGILSVDSISNSVNAQALGQGSLIQLGTQTANVGFLEFTGNTDSTTDKLFRIGLVNNSGQGGGGGILNNGTGSLTFTNATFNQYASDQRTTRSLTLGGSYSGGFNEIQGAVQDGDANPARNGKIALTVSGSKWKLSGTNTYTGATNVTGGTLLVNGSTTASSTVTVSTGATLGGTGRVGGAVSVATGGFLSPGASIESLATGAVTMDTNSTFAYEAANNSATGADLLAVNGMLDLSISGVNLSFDSATLAALEGGGWGNGDKLTLISYLGTPLTAGFIGYADDTTYMFGSNSWLFNYNDTTPGGNYASDADLDGQINFITMTYTAVPEPSAASLLGALGLILCFRRRR